MNAPSLKKMLQIEQACDRFESAWQLGDRPRIEDTLQQFPEIAGDLLKPLLTLEVDYRRQRGEKPGWSDYLSRFPQATEVLTELLGPNLSATTIFEQLAKYGLISTGSLAVLQQQVGDRIATGTGEELLAELVERQLLTEYQAQRLLAGKGKSLRLENYILLEKLGQGGMGTVWKARDRQSAEVVALKVLDQALTQRKDMISRFQRESRLAISLKHRNVVTTYRADQYGPHYFLVMEYIHGTDLASHLKADGPVTVSTALNWIRQIADGLDCAHRQGIIHRDIKLANILRDTAGTIKILDLGLARFEGGEGSSSNLTGTGDFLGTVDYISPEQALCAKTADARSDVYSLGMVLWYLLLNRPAYDGKSIAARILAHRDAPIPLLTEALASSEQRNDVRLSAVADLFRKMVAKAPAERYQSMSEVMTALRAIDAVQ